MIIELLIPAFFAGLLTFLAPCTLPLVPGYLAFVSGVSLSDLADSKKASRAKRRIFFNGLLFVIGFSVVFVVLGSLISWLGGTLFAQYRLWLARIGGIFVITFGLFLLQTAIPHYISRWPWLKRFQIPFFSWLSKPKQLPLNNIIKPGNPVSSIAFGAAFAAGWTPCVGPVLGAILTLAATNTTVGQGAILLSVFSLGLGIPFLVLAAGIEYFNDRMPIISRFLPLTSIIGGLFIVFLGILVLTNRLGLWISFFFKVTSFINYEGLLNYL